MIRYAKIREKMPREFLLLQGQGCAWRRCSFCDYYTDVSEDPFQVNQPVLRQVTGEFGVLDLINSGSCTEFDQETLAMIADIVREKAIHTLWFEAHWLYRHRLSAFRDRFPGVTVKFRVGAESFDEDLRQRWNKGMAKVSPQDIARYFQGVCLLVGLTGQKRETISRDIRIAMAHFEYFSVNVFCENTTAEKRDDALIHWFLKEWGETLKAHPKAECLMENTDLGVG